MKNRLPESTEFADQAEHYSAVQQVIEQETANAVAVGSVSPSPIDETELPKIVPEVAHYSAATTSTVAAKLELGKPETDASASEQRDAQRRFPIRLSTAWAAELCLWFTAISWGTNLLVVKVTLGTLNPWVFNTSRLTLATLMLGFLAWLETRFRPTTSTKLLWKPFIGFALMNGFLYQVFFFLGISQTTAGNTALLLSSMPMWTAAFSFLFIQERLPALTWTGLGVTFCGTLYVLLQNPTVDLSSGSYLIGNLFILFGAMTWAAATVTSRPLLQVMSPLRLAFLSSLYTMPFHFMLCWPFVVESWPQLFLPANIAAIVYSGSISTGVAYATWHYGVRHLGGSRAGVYQNVVTLVAVIGGWMFLMEPVLLPQFVGGFAIILGVILMRIKPKS